MLDASTLRPRITKSGAYDGLPNDFYHGDCCDGASISSTSIKAVLKDPSVYWHTSYLNPEAKKSESKRHFNVGSSAHILLLEPHLVEAQISVIPQNILASNGALSTKAAKEFVEVQTDAGRTVIKEEEWEMVCDMADALSNNAMVTRALKDGVIEQSHIWQDHETGVWLKSRPDFTPNKSDAFIVDYKTTDYEHIEQWEKQAMADVRVDIQAALQMWGAAENRSISPRGVLYVVQSKKPPHQIALRLILQESDNDKARDMLKAARIDLRRGINTFSHCWTSSDWPSPWNEVTELVPPSWRSAQIDKQLAEGTGNTIPPSAYAA
jgi:hypothetical protein